MTRDNPTRRKGRAPTPAYDRLVAASEYEDRGYATLCHVAKRMLRKDGYSQVNVTREDGWSKMFLGHRISWEHHHGPVPDGLHIDHLCRQRDCHEVTHLEPVTNKENLSRSPLTLNSIHAAKTHCPAGHPYDEENTYRFRGGRQCKACSRIRDKTRIRTRKLKR